MQFLLIILMSIGAAVGYGILHDLVTAHFCVEYFTIGHPPIFSTQSPILLALGWGIIATWWVGLPLGILLGMAARASRHPRLSAWELRRPIFRLLCVMGVSALIAGIVGVILAQIGAIELVPKLAKQMDAQTQVRFLGDLWAHNASYLSGFFGGLILCIRVWRQRKERSA